MMCCQRWVARCSTSTAAEVAAPACLACAGGVDLVPALLQAPIATANIATKIGANLDVFLFKTDSVRSGLEGIGFLEQRLEPLESELVVVGDFLRLLRVLDHRRLD